MKIINEVFSCAWPSYISLWWMQTS